MDEESKRKMSRMVREDNDGTKQAAAKEAKTWRSQETDKNEDARKMTSSNRQAMESRAKKMFEPYKGKPLEMLKPDTSKPPAMARPALKPETYRPKNPNKGRM